MKKLLIVALVFIVSMSALSAHEGQIGISFTPEWSWITSFEGNDLGDIDMEGTNLLLTVDGANYFGRNGSGFGVEYGLGVAFPVGSQNEILPQEDSGAGFVFRAGIGYRFEFSRLFGLALGFGLNGAYQSESFSSLDLTITGSAFELGLYGKVAADLTLIDCIRINLGIAVGGPVYNLISGEEASENINIGGVFVSPFVGVSYVY